MIFLFFQNPILMAKNVSKKKLWHIKLIVICFLNLKVCPLFWGFYTVKIFIFDHRVLFSEFFDTTLDNAVAKKFRRWKSRCSILFDTRGMSG